MVLEGCRLEVWIGLGMAVSIAFSHGNPVGMKIYMLQFGNGMGIITRNGKTRE